VIALKSCGIVLVAFLILGFGFIEPAKRVGEPWSVVLILAGVAVCGMGAIISIRRMLRASRT